MEARYETHKVYHGKGPDARSDSEHRQDRRPGNGPGNSRITLLLAVKGVPLGSRKGDQIRNADKCTVGSRSRDI